MLATYTSPRPPLPRSPSSFSSSPSPDPTHDNDLPLRPSLRRQPRFAHHRRSQSISLTEPGGLSSLLSSSCVAMLAQRGNDDPFLDTPMISITSPNDSSTRTRMPVQVQVPMLRLQPAAPMVSASLESVLFGCEPAMDIELEEDIENASTGAEGMYRPFGGPTTKSSPAKGSIFSPRPSHTHNSLPTRNPRHRRTNSYPNPAPASGPKRRQPTGRKKPTSSVSKAVAESPYKTRNKYSRQQMVVQLQRQNRTHGGAGKRETLSVLDIGNLSISDPTRIDDASTLSTSTTTKPKTHFRTNFQNAIVDFGHGSLSSRHRHSFRNLPTTTVPPPMPMPIPVPAPVQGRTMPKLGLRKLVSGAKRKEAIDEGWEMDFGEMKGVEVVDEDEDEDSMRMTPGLLEFGRKMERLR